MGDDADGLRGLRISLSPSQSDDDGLTIGSCCGDRGWDRVRIIPVRLLLCVTAFCVNRSTDPCIISTGVTPFDDYSSKGRVSMNCLRSSAGGAA